MEWIPISTSISRFPAKHQADCTVSSSQAHLWWKQLFNLPSNPGASESFSGKRWYKALELILERRARLQRTIFCFTSMPGCYVQGREIASSPWKGFRERYVATVETHLYMYIQIYWIYLSFCVEKMDLKTKDTVGSLLKFVSFFFAHYVVYSIRDCDGE